MNKGTINISEGIHLGKGDSNGSKTVFINKKRGVIQSGENTSIVLIWEK